jgi:cytochrome c553
MSGMVAALSDDDLRNLAAYFAAQKVKPDVAKDRSLVTAGQRLYRGGDSETGVPACSGCHSPDGAGIPAQYPRLAGQHGEYTNSQLQYFRSGERANDPNAMMRTIASRRPTRRWPLWPTISGLSRRGADLASANLGASLPGIPTRGSQSQPCALSCSNTRPATLTVCRPSPAVCATETNPASNADGADTPWSSMA